jgi:hypothetical protein
LLSSKALANCSLKASKQATNQPTNPSDSIIQTRNF